MKRAVVPPKRRNSEVVSGPKFCDGSVIVPVNQTLTFNSSCLSNGTLCLEGGTGPHEGNVYVGMGSFARPVCDDSWDATDGLVACKQLNYSGVVRVTREGHFGRVSGGGSVFAMDNTGCQGTESRLVDCPHSPTDDCGNSEVAGVVCDTRCSTFLDTSDPPCPLRNTSQIEAEARGVEGCFEEGVSFHHGKITHT
jgi:hypothetical protein